MDYRKWFDEMHPGFFGKSYVAAMPEEYVFTELVMDLRKECPEVPAYRPPEGITFGVFRGDYAQLQAAVGQVDEDWVKYFPEGTRVFCAFDGDAAASFCILSDWGVHGGLRIGGPGCVGTVPAYRGKGIGLEMVRLATEQQAADGFDISWIHYTHLEKWYSRLGYRTVLKWNRTGFVFAGE
jgi:GNAT superfamily N-acetyltransferase